MFKITASIILLFIALAVQFWLASVGITANFSFAALIVFAFLLDVWEVVFLSLVAVFIWNWQPAISPEAMVFALFPVAVYFLRGITPWQSWIVIPLTVAVGFLSLYFAANPGMALHFPTVFIHDLAASLIFAFLVWYPLTKWGD